MTPLHDYVYRFSRAHLHMAGRCRVRIYKRKNGGHTVLLTELNDNPGESIASACQTIASDLAARWAFSPRTTRWLIHDATLENLPQRFDEVQFTWEDNYSATLPQWKRLSQDQSEALTGETLSALNRRIGDTGN